MNNYNIKFSERFNKLGTETAFTVLAKANQLIEKENQL